VTGGAIAFPRMRTTNLGQNWVEILNGLGNSGDWPGTIKNDGTLFPYTVTLYTACNGFIYNSTNWGDNWTKKNNTVFGNGVSSIAANHNYVYACLTNAAPPYTGNQLKVFDVTQNQWYERSTGFPC
jgi:hypothetical protein